MSKLHVEALIATSAGYLSEKALSILSAREIAVLYARLFEGRSLDETGQVILSLEEAKPLSRERIRQIEGYAVRRLRHWIQRHH